MKVELSEEDLLEHLDEQIDFLKASSTSFDAGFDGEIKRLAISVRVLVHDTGSSTSLLALLNKKGIQFLDTSLPFDEQNVMTHSSLIQISMGQKGNRVLPFLDDGPFDRQIDFEPWWNGIVFVDKDRNEFSRKDIVLALANKEGGAHIDNKLDAKYVDLRKNNSLNLHFGTVDGKQVPADDQVPSTMRQIAHELIKTLQKDYICHRDTSKDDGVLVMGMSLVEGSNPPPLHENNLTKIRPLINGKKIGRNDLCTCGSGKKYKKCCIA